MKPLPLVYAVLFAVAHTQSPLYYSNQNQYFLKGVAAGSDTPLAHDWLVNTADPVPVFSKCVELCVRYVGEWPFQAAFFVALIGYFLAAWRLVEKPMPLSPVGGVVFAFAFTAIHAGLLRWLSTTLFGEDYLWFFQSGLANQYLLGPGLQPSVVGVLLLWSVAEYANKRPVLAAALAASATLIHSTYLMSAAMLVGGFVLHLLVLRQWKAAFLSALVSVLLVLPTIVYTLLVFGSADADTFRESQRILAEVRIPHHCRPARWFDWAAGMQVVWMLLGLVLLRKTRLFVPLAVVSGLVLIGTLAVIATENPTLSLLFPWRVTAVLIPVSTAVVLGWLTSRNLTPRPPLHLWRGGVQSTNVPDRIPSHPRMSGENTSNDSALNTPSPFMERGTGGEVHSIAFIALLILFAFGSAVTVYVLRLGYREPESESQLLDHIAATRTDADLYLIPSRFPGPPKSSGVYSKTFTPPQPAFSDLARFRLATRARLFVDFKAIPYKDADVIEWHRRVSRCERWYSEIDWDYSGVVDDLAAEGITHVIVPADKYVVSSRLVLELETPRYNLYRVR